MTNHAHLLMTPDSGQSISKAMQSLGRCYVQYFNDVLERTGTLREGRFKATPVDSDRHLLGCYRYIEENPLRAGMVASPADYPWSSHRAQLCCDSDYEIPQAKALSISLIMDDIIDVVGAHDGDDALPPVGRIHAA